MCLSLKVVGTCVKVSAILVLILGILGIVCAVSIGKDDIMVSDVQDTKKSIMAVTIVFSVLLIIIGLSGTIGAWRDKPCCLFIYNIGIAIFFIAFLIISIVAFGVFKKYYNLDLKNQGVCESQSWLSPLNNVAINGEKYLCGHDCACGLENKTSVARTLNQISFDLDFEVAANNTNNTETTNNTNNSNTNTSNNTNNNKNTTDNSKTNNSNSSLNISVNGSIRLQDCPNYKTDFTTTQRELAVTMELLERNFHCSGVCRNPSYYSFSDINSGTPKDDCATILVDIFINYSKKIGAATVVITVLLFLTLVASFCLCCHPDKRKEEGGFYKKMGSI